MQSEQNYITLVKRPRGRPRVLTDEERKEHRQKTLRGNFKNDEERRYHKNEIARNHYNRHKDDIERYLKKQETARKNLTPERYHEIKESTRRRYYLLTYGNLNKYVPKSFENS